jgi:hypothetical protein
MAVSGAIGHWSGPKNRWKHTEVAADQNHFPLLPPLSRMRRERGLQMLNLGRAPSGSIVGSDDYKVLRRPSELARLTGS